MDRIRLLMNIFYLTPDGDDIMHYFDVKTNKEKINPNDDTNDINENLFNVFMTDYNEKLEYGFRF